MTGRPDKEKRPTTAKSILAMIRVPYLEKIEGLNTLLGYLGECGYQVQLISPSDPHYLPPTHVAKGCSVTIVSRSLPVCGRRLPCPTTVRLLAEGWRSIWQRRPHCLIAGDRLGSVVASGLSRFFGVPLVIYGLELPAKRTQRRTFLDRMERHCIRRSDLYITHDDYHAEFVAKESGIARERILSLPNATPGEPVRAQSRWLQEALELSDREVIVLHAGGLGRWHSCLELARAVTEWPDHWRLVFHTSHNVNGDSYGEDVKHLADGNKIVLHNHPLGAGELDRLVASAHVGVATYSVEELGYRAELMGFASGKIGRYLKNGVPVVATDLPTVRPYLSKYRCGICVRDPSQIRSAIERIMADYATYSENAVRCYDELWEPSRFLEVIGERIAQLRR